MTKTRIAETGALKQKPQLTKKIGGTTYMVSIHFNNASKENLNDKIVRLIKNDTFSC